MLAVRRALRSAVIVGLLAIGWAEVAVSAVQPVPESQGQDLGPKLEAALDEEFLLGRGETALIKELDVLVTVTHLGYSRCLAGMTCFAPDGPRVNYEVYYARRRELILSGNNLLTAPAHFPWFVRFLESDGETFARFVVNDTIGWCKRVAPESAAMACWRRTAELTQDASHCSPIADVPERSSCIFNVARISGDPKWCDSAPQVARCHETLARELKRPQLCENVTEPRDYCITAAVAKSGDIGRCKRIASSRGDCYFAAARQAGHKGVCDRLENPYRTECDAILRSRPLEIDARPPGS